MILYLTNTHSGFYMQIFTDKSKKSQMEIMGLVIIIILVSIGMLLTIQFVVKKQPEDIRKTFTHEQLAANTVYALLRTTTDCKDRSLASLIQDCSSNRPNGLINCREGKLSCEYAEDVISSVLNSTLEKWNKDYYFTIKSGTLSIIALGSQCPNAKTSSLPCCPIPTGIIAKLDICV